jgi:hypothetical protein
VCVLFPSTEANFGSENKDKTSTWWSAFIKKLIFSPSLFFSSFSNLSSLVSKTLSGWFITVFAYLLSSHLSFFEKVDLTLTGAIPGEAMTSFQFEHHGSKGMFPSINSWGCYNKCLLFQCLIQFFPSYLPHTAQVFSTCWSFDFGSIFSSIKYEIIINLSEAGFYRTPKIVQFYWLILPLPQIFRGFEAVLRQFWGSSEAVLRQFWGSSEAVLRQFWGSSEASEDVKMWGMWSTWRCEVQNTKIFEYLNWINIQR